MLLAKQKQEWAHTSSMLAMMANTALGKPKGKTYSAFDFSPFPQEYKKHDKVINGLSFKKLKEIIKKGGSLGI